MADNVVEVADSVVEVADNVVEVVPDNVVVVVVGTHVAVPFLDLLRGNANT